MKGAFDLITTGYLRKTKSVESSNMVRNQSVPSVFTADMTRFEDKYIKSDKVLSFTNTVIYFYAYHQWRRRTVFSLSTILDVKGASGNLRRFPCLV